MPRLLQVLQQLLLQRHRLEVSLHGCWPLSQHERLTMPNKHSKVSREKHKSDAGPHGSVCVGAFNGLTHCDHVV